MGDGSFRIGGTFNLNKLHLQDGGPLEKAKGYDYMGGSVAFGYELNLADWLTPYLDLNIDFTFGNQNTGGSKRILAGPSVGAKVPIFWKIANLFGAEANFLRPINVSPYFKGLLGVSSLDLGFGYEPISKFDFIHGLGGMLLYSYMSPERGVGFDIGVGMGKTFSENRNYEDTEIKAIATLRLTSIKKDTCEDERRKASISLRECKTSIDSKKIEVSNLSRQIYLYAGAIKFILNHQKRLYTGISNFCGPRPKIVNEPKGIEGPDIPEWHIDQSSCPAELKSTNDALNECRSGEAEKSLDAWISSAEHYRSSLIRDLKTIFNWRVSCDSGALLPRVVQFANDNPTKALDWQERPSWKGERVFSIPDLDELIIYMALNPSKRVIIFGFANDTGDPERNEYLAKTRASFSYQYLTLQSSLANSECGEDKFGKYCKINDQVMRGTYITEKELGSRAQDILRGAKPPKWYTIDPSRITAKAFKTEEIEGLIKAGFFKPLLPNWVFDELVIPKSHIFRSVFFAVVDKSDKQWVTLK